MEVYYYQFDFNISLLRPRTKVYIICHSCQIENFSCGDLTCSLVLYRCGLLVSIFSQIILSCDRSLITKYMFVRAASAQIAFPSQTQPSNTSANPIQFGGSGFHISPLVSGKTALFRPVIFVCFCVCVALTIP